MSLTSFYTALTGPNSNALSINVIGNNLANINTTAYKASKTSFAELMGGLSTTTATNGNPVQVGLGSNAQGVIPVFNQGSIADTGRTSKAYRYDSNCWQVPSLVHEMSSREHCYSWNFFHPHQTGDRARFIEGMYSEIAGGMSRQTLTVCETRGGITGVTPCLPSFYGVRLAVLDDEVAPQELHLLRLVPLAWLRKERKLAFTHAPTIFGRVNLSAKLDQNGKGLELTWDAKYRTTPRQVVLHVPPVSGLERTTLNGKALSWDGKARTISIP